MDARVLFLVSIGKTIPYMPRRGLAWVARCAGLASRNSPNVRIAAEELRKLLGDSVPEAALREEAIRGSINHKMDLFEIWSFPRLSAARLSRYAELVNRERIDRALEGGKGVVIGVSHYGSWKMVIAALAYSGYKVNQIGLSPEYFHDPARPRHHNMIMEMEQRGDASLPASFIYLDREKLLRPVYEALRRNELVLNSFDGFIGSSVMEVPFLRGTNRIAAGPAMLAERTGAPLLPVFAVRQPNGRHHIRIEEPIPFDSALGRDERVRKAVQDYAALFAEYVRRHPSHYCRTLYDRRVDPRR